MGRANRARLEQKAFFNLSSIRTFGEVVKKNPLTTLVEIDFPGYTEEEVIELFTRGSSIHKHIMELEECGLTHSSVIKRHNIKHNVVFI